MQEKKHYDPTTRPLDGFTTWPSDELKSRSKDITNGVKAEDTKLGLVKFSSAKPMSTEEMSARQPDASPSSTGSPPAQQHAINGGTKGHNVFSASKSKTNPPPINGAIAPRLNPRSCVTCRKRKVRCDKRHPCINCAKAGTDCVFPGPGRAPRRSRKPQDTELLARLRRLEGVVKHMGKDPEEAMESADNASRSGADDLANKDPGCDNSQFFAHLNQNGDQKTDKLVRDFGRLVVEEGRSRYVANKFWTALSEEVGEPRCGIVSAHILCRLVTFGSYLWCHMPSQSGRRRRTALYMSI